MKTDTFIESVFEDEVMRALEGVYGEMNPCTIFYLASDKMGGDQMSSVAAPWTFTTLKAKLAAATYLKKLANKAFSSLCGLKDENGDWLETGAQDAYFEAVANETGCHVDLGKAQYTQMRRLRAVEKTVRELLGEK